MSSSILNRLGISTSVGPTGISAGLKRSVPAKFTAMGFIIDIIVGQLWITYLMLNQPTPIWMQWAFVFGTLLVVAGALGLSYLLIKNALSTRAQNVEGSV